MLLPVTFILLACFVVLFLASETSDKNIKHSSDIFRNYTIDQKISIENGLKNFEAIAENKAKYQRDDENIKQRDSDGRCPMCHNSKVVNKISHVHGQGKVSGDFYLGYGHVRGDSYVDTKEVNHCNDCGNQWKKYKVKYKYQDDIMVDMLDEIETAIEGKYTYAKRIFEQLKSIPAESIYLAIQNMGDDLDPETRDISLDTLKIHFKSVKN